MAGILSGIRVLEWASYLNGPAAGGMLADLGAEVIKVEEPGRGDPMRGMKLVFGVDVSLPDHSNTLFEVANRGKKSVTLDLRRPEGQDLLRALARRCDVFLTNYRPPVLAQMGVDPAALQAENPRLVYVMASMYGPRGPLAERRGFDPIAQARSGVMWAVGLQEHEEPVFITGGLLDMLGATLAAWGAVLGLLHRERTGRGLVVDSSLLGSAMHIQAINLSTIGFKGQGFRRHSRLRAEFPLTNYYRCADGRWLMLTELEPSRFFPQLAEALGHPEWAEDPRFATARDRMAHADELRALLERTFRERPLAEWLERFEERNCQFPYSPVQTPEEVLEDPQAHANRYVVEVEHPHAGRVKMPGFPLGLSEGQAEPAPRAPRVGEHTEEVLTGLLGLSRQALEDLQRRGIL